MITKTYMIPEENVENLEKKFNAAARKIRKINPELEPTMTKSNHTIVLVRKIELRPCDCRSESTVKKVPYEARRVELKIPDEVVFAENNWAFGGSVESSGIDGKTSLMLTCPARKWDLSSRQGISLRTPAPAITARLTASAARHTSLLIGKLASGSNSEKSV